MQSLWHQSSTATLRSMRSRSSSGRRQRPWRFRSAKASYSNAVRPTGLEIARFGLLTIATLPFTSWIALFSYDYYYRVDLCRESLTQQDDELEYPRSMPSSQQNAKESPEWLSAKLIGREAQFEEVRSLLSSNPPHQILVVAGPNESGKSHFVSSLMQTIDPNKQGVTYIQSAQIVDSMSTLTQAFVKAFHLQWLQLRYSLVDVLPFAGSEILVMKERYSERDLAQALDVITEALKQNAKQKRRQRKAHLLPVIVIDGLGEGSSWFRSPEGRQSLQQIFKWCITITKERGLAHVILTGNEELVISLTDQNRMTRGHVHVIGLSTLEADQASPVVWQEWPDATSAEIQKLTDTFGGFVHDLHAASRQIQQKLVQFQGSEGGVKTVPEDRRAQIIDQVLSARFRLQVERATAAFAKGKDENDRNPHVLEEDDDAECDPGMDPYLDPLKEVYSEAHAKKNVVSANEESLLQRRTASWSQLQLWRTLQRLVESSSQSSSRGMAVPFGELRDEIFNGDITPLLELMNEDVLGFEIGESQEGCINTSADAMTESQEWSWQVKPATPALGRVFQYLVHNSHLKERFQEMERKAERREKLSLNDQERRQLRLERRRLDMRKASLLKTAELGSAFNMDTGSVSRQMDHVYKSIIDEDVAMERRGRELLEEQKLLLLQTLPDENLEQRSEEADSMQRIETELSRRPISGHSSIQKHLRAAILDTCEQEGGRLLKVRESFQKHATRSGMDGVTAADVVRLINESTGEDIDLQLAESFIRAWDVNKDEHLDYDEFIDMLLADVNMQKRKRRRKKKTKVETSKPS